jgi:hypothetical protein
LLQDAVAAHLAQGASDVMDGLTIPVAHGARACNPGWLAATAHMGKEGNDRYGYSVRLMMVINSTGSTGWAVASGNAQERWGQSCFAVPGCGACVQGPFEARGHKPRVIPT